MFMFLKLFAVCLFVFSARDAGGQPSAKSQGPKFELVGPSTQEFGKINSYEKKTVNFRVKNTGGSAGTLLNLISTCSCTSGSTDKTRVEPQEEAVVTLVLDPSTVRGIFKRGIWVETDDPERPRFALTLHGEVLPLFHGLPESPRQFAVAEGATWTNRFTLTEAETNVFVGAPILLSNEKKLLAKASIVTNEISGKKSFEITLTVTALAPGQQTLLLSLPLEGRPNLHPIKVTFYANVGNGFKVVPSQILLTSTEKPLTRRLNVVSSDKSLATNALTWTPRREGVSAAVQTGKKSSILTVTLTLSPEAVANLLKEKEAQMTFHYPDCKPASVTFVSQSASETISGKADTSRPPVKQE